MRPFFLLPLERLDLREPLRRDRGERSLRAMSEKRTKADKVLRQPDHLQKQEETSKQMLNERRQAAIRSGKERRAIDIPPPAGSPVRSGLDRRKEDRRGSGRA